MTLGLTGGVVLLVASVVRSPARPAWEMAPLSPAELAVAEQTSQAVTPVVGQIDREADRLRQRLADAADFAAPARDPFRFRTRTDTKPATRSGLIAAPPRSEMSPDLLGGLRPPAPPPIAAPTVIALTEDAGAAGAVTRTAMIAMGEVTAIVKVGDTFDRFRIVGITPTGVELVDLTSTDRIVTTISIR